MEKRMEAIIDLCQTLPVTVDVGCDHGYVGLELLRSDKTNHLIACDISKPSLQKAINLLNDNGFTERFSARVGDGLSVINKGEKIDQVVIAGMGGMEIIHILKEFNKPNAIRNLVLQPMNQILQLREFLCTNGYEITRDLIIKEGDKFYHILSVRAGHQELSELELGFGAIYLDRKSKDFADWLKQKEKKTKAILKQMPKDNQKYDYFKHWLLNMKAIKQTLTEL